MRILILEDNADRLELKSMPVTMPPLIIHTTNELAALQMQHLLSVARWRLERVTPYDEESWIGEDTAT